MNKHLGKKAVSCLFSRFLIVVMNRGRWKRQDVTSYMEAYQKLKGLLREGYLQVTKR